MPIQPVPPIYPYPPVRREKPKELPKPKQPPKPKGVFFMDLLFMALTVAQAVVAEIPKDFKGKCISSTEIGISQLAQVQTPYGPQMQFFQERVSGRFAGMGVIEGTRIPDRVKLDSREAVPISQSGAQQLVDFWKECQE